MIATGISDYKTLKVLKSNKPRCSAQIMIAPDPKLDLVCTKHTYLLCFAGNENIPNSQHESSSASEGYVCYAIITSPS